MPEVGARIQTLPAGPGAGGGQTEITMPTVHEMFPTRFLSQADVAHEVVVTIDTVEQADVSGGVGEPKFEWVVRFHDDVKPLLLSFPLALVLASVLGTDDAAEWTGRRLILYWDPNVYFAGRLAGAIRARIPSLMEHEEDKRQKKTGRKAS